MYFILPFSKVKMDFISFVLFAKLSEIYNNLELLKITVRMSVADEKVAEGIINQIQLMSINLDRTLKSTGPAVEKTTAKYQKNEQP